MLSARPNRCLALAAVTVLSVTAGARDVPNVWGVIETYPLSQQGVRGIRHYMTWGELHAKVDGDTSLVGSFQVWPTWTALDESYVDVEHGPVEIRVGRIRTSFGFSDWSEMMYGSLNHIALVRESRLVGSIRLDRDDSGAEATIFRGPIQVQAAGIDTDLTHYQVLPDRVHTGTLRVQGSFGNLILAGDALDQFQGSQTILGLDARWTLPHLIAKMEAYQGNGTNAASGFFAEATYRLPTITRTQLTFSAEKVRQSGGSDVSELQTFGVRQILSADLAVNLNYGWGKELDYYRGYSVGALAGWSLRAMYQVRI